MRTHLYAVALVVLVAAAAAATDHPIAGDLLQLSDTHGGRTRLVKFQAAHDPAIAGATVDPRIAGAMLQIIGTAPGDGSTGVITLPATLWKGLGTPPGSAGFMYRDQNMSRGVKSVSFKVGKSEGSLVIRGRGSNWPYAITQPQGPIDVRLTVGDDTYCARFFTFVRNATGRVIARNAHAPAACSGPVDPICTGVPAVSGTALSAVLVASGLNSPTHITAPPLDVNRVFVVEQPGRIRIIKDGTLLNSPFLAIENRVSLGTERGLLSVAFHPAFETNGRFFVDYTNTSGNTVIARYRVSSDPDHADVLSEQILVTINQPFANHNGGQLAFGPDGYLYVGMGDGGSGGDPLGNGQSDGTLLGKLLRLDVDVDAPPYHAVPPTNPHAGDGDPLGLIWAKGLRNPWRFSFDRSNGDLYIADVGQDMWEEVDVQPAASAGGENYGWNIFEGNHCFKPPAPATRCPSPPTGFTMPIHEYDHGQGCSITGGFVYRGCRMPDLRGTYFYSDYCMAFIRTFNVVNGQAQNHADRTADLAPGNGLTIDSVTSFGEDARGELYIADQGGEIYEIVPGT